MNDTDTLVQAARNVARSRIAPVARQLDENSWSEEVWEDLADLGVTAICAPEEYGGLGLPYSAYMAVTAEIARVSAVAALMPALNVLVIRALLRSGDEETRNAFLPGLVSGQTRGCWAFTEPETGSDPKAIATTATPDGQGGWTLSGGKTFISHSGHADVAVVFAQLEGRLSAFIGQTTQGFEPGPREPMLGFAGADTGPVSIESMPVRHVLGEIGEGFAVLLAGEAEAKLRASAICLGMAEHATEAAIDYARTRTHRGVPIGQKFQTIQWLVAECAARTEAIRALVERAGRLVDEGGDVSALAARVKLMSSRLAREVASDAVQVHGAYGYSREYDAEMLYRQSKMYELVQGVSELNRIIIARDALGNFHA
jgi:alkylation response protein AidB-like acyl-CoA dehydrogenase